MWFGFLEPEGIEKETREKQEKGLRDRWKIPSEGDRLRFEVITVSSFVWNGGKRQEKLFTNLPSFRPV